MRIARVLFFIVLFFSCLHPFYAQEVVYDLQGNPALKNGKQALPLKSTKALPPQDTVPLPFFDDFSFTDVYPLDSLWRENMTYVNNHLAILPPSFNVASLDAADQNGDIYSHLGSLPRIADSLTSAPIALSLHPDSNVYLSFQYQPGGYGDAPEPGDSLVLEFFAPVQQQWHHVWSVPGSSQHPFRSVVLPVTDTLFLKDGFRFRFTNYVSLTALSDPGRNSNVDFWHIDYVYLDKGRFAADTVFNDATIVYPPNSALEKYTSIPYDHYIAAFTETWTGVINLILRNNGDQLSNVERRYTVKDLQTGQTSTFSRGSENLAPFTVDTLLDLYDDPLNSSVEDSAAFEITARLITDATEFKKINDAITFHQLFYNYYAYDDGTPENGYGISGQGSEGVFGAMQFDMYKEDTLTGVNIFFNPSLNDASKAFFGIGVWNDNNGEPGELIYMKKGYQVDYGNDLYNFTSYSLDTSIILDGVFYIGWQQVTNTYMNFGLDRNAQNNSQYLFYNFDGEWTQSNVSGTLMIRPVFGEKGLSTSLQPSKPVQQQLQVYPNPASNQLNFSLPDVQGDVTLQMFSSTGQMVLSQSLRQTRAVNIRDVKPGMYFIKIIAGQEVFTSRVIIAR